MSSVLIPDTVRGDFNIEVQLAGILKSTCSKISNVSVKQLGDVFVVLPTLSFDVNLMCAIISLPFKKTIELKAPGEGRYLIHVRSMNGHSINRAFTAVVPDPS